MRIAYIISETDKAVFFERTAEELRSKGLDVIYVLINCHGGALSAYLTEHGFDVREFENKRLLNSRNTINQVKRLLKERNIDTIHCHLSHANWVGLWAGKLAGVPQRIYTRHSGKPLSLSKKEQLIDKIQNSLATKIVSISANIDGLLAKQKVPKKKRVLIHHGFDLQRFENRDPKEEQRIRNTFNPQDKHPVIGVIARWMEWKGIHFTIGAFKDLLNTHPNALLCLFGGSANGDYHKQLREQLNTLPAESYRIVEFEPNVYDLYSLFDIYVHVPVNAHCEAFGQTYIEALAAGIPSVFTLSGVAREFIEDGKNARIVPFRNSKEITTSILDLLELSGEQKKTLIANGRQSVMQRFSFDRYIDELIALYNGNSSQE